MSKTTYWISGFLILWLIALAVFHFGFSYQEKLLQDLPHRIVINLDQQEGGRSEIELLQADDTIGFWLELKDFPDSLNWPWADVQFHLDSPFLDLSDQDFIEFEVKSSRANKHEFGIALHYPDSTNIPFHALSHPGLVDTNYSHLKLPIKDFTTMRWWLLNKKISGKEQEAAVHEKTKSKSLIYFSIGSGTRSKSYEREWIHLHSLKITKYLLWPYSLFAGVLLLALLVMVIKYGKIYLEKKRKATVVLNYAQTTIPQTINTDSALEFIRENYANSNMSLSSVSASIQLSESKISLEIKKTTSLTFKKYLNQVRIDQAKKLLIEEKDQVSFIAEKVGYDNTTNFNRVFKSLVGRTPSEYRSNNT